MTELNPHIPVDPTVSYRKMFGETNSFGLLFWLLNSGY